MGGGGGRGRRGRREGREGEEGEEGGGGGRGGDLIEVFLVGEVSSTPLDIFLDNSRFS